MTDYSSYATMLFEKKGRVLTVTLNRPELMNAISDQMHGEFARLFQDLNSDKSIDIVVLTGSGKAFSAGGDASHLRVLRADRALFDATRAEAKKIVFGLLECEKIIVAKVNGHAMGLGATIALMCDLIFAADHALIGDPHVKVGLVAGDGGAMIWPLVLGPAKAKEFLLTGDPLTAERAAALGLVNQVHPAAELDAAVDQFVEKLAAGAMTAIKYTKIAATLHLKQLVHQMFDTSIAYEFLSSQTEDHLEGINAFAEKRPAKFEGK